MIASHAHLGVRSGSTFLVGSAIPTCRHGAMYICRHDVTINNRGVDIVLGGFSLSQQLNIHWHSRPCQNPAGPSPGDPLPWNPLSVRLQSVRASTMQIPKLTSVFVDLDTFDNRRLLHVPYRFFLTPLSWSETPGRTQENIETIPE